jgi:hypothetical protein
MAGSVPTIADLYKAKLVTDRDVARLVREVLDGVTDRAPLADGYAVDLGAAVKANEFASRILANPECGPGARQNAARTAILLAQAEKA